MGDEEEEGGGGEEEAEEEGGGVSYFLIPSFPHRRTFVRVFTQFSYELDTLNSVLQSTTNTNRHASVAVCSFTFSLPFSEKTAT